MFTAAIVSVSGFYFYIEVAEYYDKIEKEENSIKYTHAQIACQIFHFQGLLVPLIVILLKKNEDFFKCFSKVDNLAKVSIF
jgi:hypothetical protein